MTAPNPDDVPTDAEIVSELLGDYNTFIGHALAAWAAMTPEQLAEVRRFTRGSDDQPKV